MTTLIHNVPPGTIPPDLIAHVNGTMMSTIQECAMVSGLLESGDLEGAMNALLQMRINSAVVTETIERAMEIPRSERSCEAPNGTGHYCLRCRRLEEPGDDADWVWLLPGTPRNLCSDCEKPSTDGPIIRALLALHHASSALHNQIQS